MNNLDFKIAFRTFLKAKWYNLLNILGLSLGLAAFIFVTLYVDHETSYDKWNKNYKRVYLVERELPNGPSPYTPAPLAATLKAQCPEIEEVGRTNTALFQIPFYTSDGRFLIKKWAGADYSIAKILGIKPKGFNLKPDSQLPTTLLSKETAEVLFPKHETIINKTVNMMSKSGMPFTVAGVVDDIPGNTNFKFDCIGFSNDIASGKDQSYGSRVFQTYILVKPDADIAQLSKKIDAIYKKAALADTSRAARESISPDAPAIYLDALQNLHLKPHYGSPVGDHIVKGLMALAIIILVVTGVNFTNLYITQASRRAKEVGIKKVNGIKKGKIALQFILEIFIQCLIGLAIAFVLVVAGLPYFNQLLRVDLLISGIGLNIVIQLIAMLIALTLLAGVYPALLMAGFNPAVVLRGDQFTAGGRLSWLKTGITVLQFTFAIVFVITLVVINQQIRYMRTQDAGFTARQVVYVDNLAIFNTPDKFTPVRDRIKAIPGVKHVTVSTNVPGGIKPVSNEYTVNNKALTMNTIGVDYDYFETLNINLQQGRFFNQSFPGDSVNVILNNAAVKALGLQNPVGATINGCGGSYKVIGVSKDIKAYGFEENVQPTVYLMKDNCGLSKTQIMISAESKAIAPMLKTLNAQWKDINKLDGDTFSYHFLDELYGQLFIRQEQLQSVLYFFSALAVFIASLGTFSSAANAIRIRTKEIAIRKVFGAMGRQLMATLSKPFFYAVILANVIAWPLSFILTYKWLQTFAYRIQLTLTPFALALGISLSIVLFTVCLQVLRAVRFNPASKLKM
ncbi:FtsX-like permease family protein [Mucilaginibacter achroorhodeus]|uniref:FtsX-like permease family protein n=1 Tax=Mucilaginibacter achroorhodeus TaxID=2599294 RepID=A0A563U8K0_9SPHI|nr:ABC transporter permease [Mucilaginibacter achroorhodeus]TWR27687.1 FtsX-like permease family protein [Mucilaginibacter achroorhodeus]